MGARYAAAARARWVVACALAITGAASPAMAQEAAPSLRVRMLAAEDARDASPAGIAPLLEGLRSSDVELQRIAVRALGRLEDPTLIGDIALTLSANEASVRAEAANALAQACTREASGAACAVIARSALEKETHALVRGALLLTLGRLKYTSLDEWRSAEVLLTDTLFPEQSDGPRATASPAVLLNGLRGLFFLARQAPGKRPLHQVTVAALARVAASASRADEARAATQPPTTGAATRIRVLALQALRAGGVTDTEPFARARTDPDPAVRRVAVVPLTAGPLLPPGFLDALERTAAASSGAATASAARTRLLRAAEEGLRRQLEDDPSWSVRFEALRGYLQQASPNCALLLRRLDDASAHVMLQAIDGFAKACPADRSVLGRLRKIASGGGNARERATWHARAHALVTLAQVDQAAAAPIARAAARDANPWLRMYAARALQYIVPKAATREDPDAALLMALMRDANVNVATAAIEGLAATVAHAADPEYVAALARNDRASGPGVEGVPTGYELILAAVKALTGSVHQGVMPAMLDTLDRLSADARETSRDPRLAIVAWLTAYGDASAATRVQRYVGDFDHEVAGATAAFVSAKGGVTVKAAPRRLPRAPMPTEADLAALATTRVVFEMAGGGRVVFGLLPNEAPLNALRFVRLAERGFFDRRTIHRVVANFVVQGGSPGANEYAGDGPFSRDEVGLASNADGTVGLSTRGRDTGDGQFYVNTNDNTRLDHTYTVFGVVEAGRDVIDRWMEGDVVAKATVTRQ